MAQVTLMLWLLLIPVLLYFSMLIFLTRNLSGINVYRTEKSPHTKVTIVIACRNEESTVPYLLSDIISQDYPLELMEVIIVDDWSGDSTIKVASAYRQIKDLKVIKNTGRGKKSAIKTGVEAAENNLIITTDADCRFDKKWLSTIASFYEEKNPDLIIGPVEIVGRHGFFQRFQELEFLSLQAITAGTAAAGDPVMCNGANLAFSRESWLKHNSGLKEEIPSGDDIFFLHSLKGEKDTKICWLESTDAVVRTSPSQTLVSFLKQRARWISKSSSYDDRFTKIIAIVTFVTIMDLLILLAAGFINPLFFKYLGVGFIIKSLGDMIILAEMTRRRSRNDLLLWVLPSQVIYPFYVLAVSVYSLFRKRTW
jgi:cellulose synthase/poly-beta-1,6-N-acetylglucosamine synthase-like glycosyltransferase